MKSLKSLVTDAGKKTAVVIAVTAGLLTVTFGAPSAEAAAPDTKLCTYSAFRVREFSIVCGSLAVLRRLHNRPAGNYQYGETKEIGRGVQSWPRNLAGDSLAKEIDAFCTGIDLLAKHSCPTQAFTSYQAVNPILRSMSVGTDRWSQMTEQEKQDLAASATTTADLISAIGDYDMGLSSISEFGEYRAAHRTAEQNNRGANRTGDSSDSDRSNEAGNEDLGAPGPGDSAFDDGRWD